MNTVRLLARMLLGVGLAAAFPLHAAAPGAAPQVVIPAVHDLQGEAGHGLPLMLEFHSAHCTYCEELEADFLRPMLISGDYDNKVRIRRLSIDNPSAPVTDFDGRRTTVGDLVSRYRITVTPTLLFLGPGGKELTQRMVGLTTPDFFGGYLDEAIDRSGARLRTGAAQR